MNWDAIGAVGEIVGAVAVIATLAYLARQIALSTEMARAAQNKSIMESWEDFNNMILSSPEIAELLSLLKNESNELSDAQLVQVHHFAYRILNTAVGAELSYANGQLSKEEFDVHKQSVATLLEKYPGFVNHVVEIYDQYPSTWHYEIYEPIRNRKNEGN